MHKFDYSFLDDGMLPSSLINVTASIYTLKTEEYERKHSFEQLFLQLEDIAKIQSVRSSNAIEGIITSDERIRAIVTKSSAPLNHNEEEIAGYRDALALIHTNHDELSFSEDMILQLHKLMYSFVAYEGGGEYKKEDNAIIEIDASGNRRVRFAPVPAGETPDAMEQLMLAYMDAANNPNINRLLLIPCVILDFLCIHPFADGNGRMSRLLSSFLLYKNEFDVGKYISFEEQINKNKAYYYESLKQSSVGWHENKNSYIPFIISFLTTLYQCYRELDKRFAVVHDKKVTKGYRIESLILNSLAPISKSEVCSMLPDISPTTVEAVIGNLVKEGTIIKVGSGRNTKYIKV